MGEIRKGSSGKMKEVLIPKNVVTTRAINESKNSWTNLVYV